METGKQTALCPDGIERPYTVVDGDALVVAPGGSTVNGIVVDGKFRPHARHHGAHLMWYPRSTVARRIQSDLFDYLERTFGDSALGACDTAALRLGILVEGVSDETVVLVDPSGEVFATFECFSDALSAIGVMLDDHFDDAPIDVIEQPSPTLVIPRERSLEVVYKTSEGVRSAEELFDRPGSSLIDSGERWSDFTSATLALASNGDL